jgi:multicomponent Na+:H+ antiporter subunit G
MLAIIGAIIVLLGAILLFIASLGLFRMPDIFNRMQAGTKATTLGSMLVYLGFILIEPTWWAKLLLLMVFIFLTNPLSSHALARSALFQKLFRAKLTSAEIKQETGKKYEDASGDTLDWNVANAVGDGADVGNSLDENNTAGVDGGSK